MAVIPLAQTSPSNSEVITWTPLAASDTGAPYEMQHDSGAIGAVQVTGTFGGTAVTMEISNDGSNWFPLKDTAGTAVSFNNAAGIVEIGTGARYIRPKATGGTSVAVTVIACLRG